MIFGDDDDDDLGGQPHEEEIQEADDAGLDDDESGDEAEAGQESPDEEAEEGQVDDEARRPSRATSAVQKAKSLAREAAAKADRLERELQELRAERERARQPQGETPEQEAAKLSLMTAEERMDYKFEKATQAHQRQINLIAFQSADNADKAAYQAKGAYDPRFKKYEADVERLLAEERKAGRSFPRETILKFVLGEKVMASKQDIQRQKDAGKRNVDRQRTQADASRSDRSAPRTRVGTGNTLADLEKRLDGVVI